MGALDGLPGIVLRRAELLLLRRMPADGGGIEEHLGALQRGKPRGLGIPLIPADERAHAAKGRIHGLKAQIAGRKVVLLVVERIVRDVHLAVDAGDGPIGIQRDRGVVVEPRRAALKERGDEGRRGACGPASASRVC